MQGQKMTYEVYAGGIDAVTAEFDIDYGSNDRYNMMLAAQTRGFLGKIVPWHGTFETNGWRLKEEDRPEMHKSVAVWKDEEESKEYSYGKDGSFKSLRVIEKGEDKSEKIDDELTQGTTDALTATLEMMKQVTAGGGCNTSAEVFDGDRRFELVFKHDEEEMLEATNYNVYSGPATRCTVEVKPISGKWHSKPRGWLSIQEQGREKGLLPTIWMAKIDEKGPAVPVKLRIKTDYGTLFSHLIGYKSATKEFHAEKK
jgi:hypothetical protein